MDSDLIRRIVEAALLASPQPLTPAQLAGLFPEDAPPPPGSIERALTELVEQNGQRGVALVEVASGFRFQVDAEVLPWVSRLWAERPARYSRALLETLALIAYRQPITRGEIEQIRGVSVSSHIIKTLEEREWIRVVGHRDVPGRPALFGTTRGFLDYFGLRSLDQLPPLTELQELPDLEPELPLEGISGPPAAALQAGGDATAEAAEAIVTSGPADDEAAISSIETAPADEASSTDSDDADADDAHPDGAEPGTAEPSVPADPSPAPHAVEAGGATHHDASAADVANDTPLHPESQADDELRPEQTP